MELTNRQRAWVRRARDRARLIVLFGLALYGTEFFLNWLWEIDVGGVLSGFGLLVGLCGAGCGLLWFVDAAPVDSSPADD